MKLSAFAASTFLLLGLGLFGTCLGLAAELEGFTLWGLVLGGCTRWSELVLIDLIDNLDEGVLNFNVAARTCFEVHHIIVGSETLSFIPRDHSVLLQVTLRAN